MSHEVETMAWTNTVPWHGLGVEVKDNLTVEQMLKAAQLDWTVEKKPLFAEVDEQLYPVDKQYGLVRSSDHRVLDVVGKAYRPVQNAEAFEYFRQFLDAGKATLETAGSLKEGRRVWGLANLKSSFKLKGKDEVKSYLLVSKPHEQGKSFQIMLTSVRVVCNNTLTWALNSATDSSGLWRMAHRKEFTGEVMDEVNHTLDLADEKFTQHCADVQKMAARKVTQDEQVQFLAQVFNPKLANIPVADIRQDHMTPILSGALKALEHSPGADMASAKGTAWGLVNAVSYMTDHQMGRKADSRLEKAWFGKNAAIKRRSLELAVNM